MSPRLDLPIALAAWLLGFGWLVRTGSFALLAALAGAASLRLLLGDPATRALLRWPGGRALGLGAGAGLLSLAATHLGYPPLARALPALPAATADLYRLLLGGGLGAGALPLLVLGVGAAEEVLWRGRALEPVPGASGGAAAARALAGAALYGLAHLASGSWLLPLLAFAFGAGWGLLRLATGSLWPAIVAHLAWSGAVLLVWPLARAG